MVTVGIDAATEQSAGNNKRWNFLYAPVVIAKFTFTESWPASLRGEYYQDKKGIIIPTVTPNGFQFFGASVNFDYAVNSNMLFRLEGRNPKSKDP